MLNKKTALPILIITAMLLFAVVATIIFAFTNQPKAEPIANQELAYNNDPAMNMAENEAVFETMELFLTLPPGWRMLDQYFAQETTLILTNDVMDLTIVKDPISTGGGFGFSYDGMHSEFEEGLLLEGQEIIIDGRSSYIISEIVELDSLKRVDSQSFIGMNDNLENGRYFTSAVIFPEMEMSQNGLTLGGNTYSIKFAPSHFSVYPGTEDEYFVRRFLPIDSNEYLNSVDEVILILAQLRII